MPTCRLAVGLGNDADEYRDTPHNAGFRCLEVLAERRRLSWRARKDYHAAEDGSLLMAKPRSLMNVCGPRVREALLKAGGDPSLMVVVVDDFMLPEGRLRLRRGGSSGGHNGLKSLIEFLGTEDFPRLRIGVGPVPPRMDPADYVLRRMPAERLDALAETAADALDCFLKEGLEKAMNRFNSVGAKEAPR